MTLTIESRAYATISPRTVQGYSWLRHIQAHNSQKSGDISIMIRDEGIITFRTHRTHVVCRRVPLSMSVMILKVIAAIAAISYFCAY